MKGSWSVLWLVGLAECFRLHRWSLFRRPRRIDFGTDATQATVDSYFIDQALQEARRAGRCAEVPIGAVVVERQSLHDYRIAAAEGNRVEHHHDASAHAEVLALRAAAKLLGNWRLSNATLYTSVEPCVMCFAAAHAFRIQRIVYAAEDHRLGARSVYNLTEVHPFHVVDEMIGGIGANQSATLLRDFFRQRRRQRP